MRRLLAALAAAVGVLPSTASAETSVTPQAAPAAWIAYADLVNQAIRDRLGGSDSAAVRLHAYLDQTPGPTAGSRAQLLIRVWVDGKGVINRIDFSPSAYPGADADLQGLLIGQRLSQAPPKGLLLPIRLSIGLEPASEGDDIPARRIT